MDQWQTQKFNIQHRNFWLTVIPKAAIIFYIIDGKQLNNWGPEAH